MLKIPGRIRKSDTVWTLGFLIDKIVEKARAADGISIADIRRIAGRRMAGPLLFFPAIVVVSPLSLVPTLPTAVALIVILVAGQLLWGAQVIWLPRRIRAMSLSLERLEKVVDFIRPGVTRIDKVLKPRLTFLTEGIAMRMAAGVCILVALTMPPLEFFPGASTAAGLIISIFGLSLTTRDGVLMLVALACVCGAGYLFYGLIF